MRSIPILKNQIYGEIVSISKKRSEFTIVSSDFFVSEIFVVIIDVTKKKQLKRVAYPFVTAFFYAAGRTRTGTVARLILSQVRLPIPPQRRSYELLPICNDYNSIAKKNLQVFFQWKFNLFKVLFR